MVFKITLRNVAVVLQLREKLVLVHGRCRFFLLVDFEEGLRVFDVEVLNHFQRSLRDLLIGLAAKNSHILVILE